MDIVELIDRARFLNDEGKCEEALQTLLGSALAGQNEALDFEIAALYVERGWARSEDAILDSNGGGFWAKSPEWRRDDKLAEADFTESLKWHELADAKAGLAAVYYRRGELEKAGETVAAALELDPEFRPAHIIRARLLIVAGAPVEALKLLGALGNDTGVYLVMAEALEALGRRDKMLEVLAKGILQFPGDAQLQAAMGKACTEAGEDDRACRAWRRAAEIEPGNAAYWRGLALAAARLNDEYEMTKALDKALALDEPGTQAWLDREKENVSLLDS